MGCGSGCCGSGFSSAAGGVATDAVSTEAAWLSEAIAGFSGCISSTGDASGLAGLFSSSAGLDASGFAGSTGLAGFSLTGFSAMGFSTAGFSAAGLSSAWGLTGSTSLTDLPFTGGGVTTLLGVVSTASGAVFSVTAGATMAAPREMRGD